MIDTNTMREQWTDRETKEVACDIAALCDELDAARRERDTLLLAVRRVLIRWNAGNAVGDALMDLGETVGTSGRLAATADAARRKDEAFQAMREALVLLWQWQGSVQELLPDGLAERVQAALAMADAAGKEYG